jgi:hypothetical protein
MRLSQLLIHTTTAIFDNLAAISKHSGIAEEFLGLVLLPASSFLLSTPSLFFTRALEPTNQPISVDNAIESTIVRSGHSAPFSPSHSTSFLEFSTFYSAVCIASWMDIG